MNNKPTVVVPSDPKKNRRIDIRLGVPTGKRHERER